VISDSLEKAIKEINQLSTTSYDIERYTEFKVLDYSIPYKLFEVIEEEHINTYEVSVPISGYYTVKVKAFNKEEAIELVLFDSTHNKNLYNMFNTYNEDFSVTDLSIDDCRSNDVVCKQI